MAPPQLAQGPSAFRVAALVAGACVAVVCFEMSILHALAVDGGHAAADETTVDQEAKWDAGCLKPPHLKFVHIAKNAGTTIEDVAKRKNICLGRFADLHARRESCPTWHAPPRRHRDFYCGADVFCVVRDPAARFMSAFRHNFYRNQKKARARRRSARGEPWVRCTRHHLETFVTARLRRGDAESGRFVKNMSKGGPQGCHLLAQTAYLHPTLGGRGGPCACLHALRLPTLARDFAKLGDHFDLDFDLGDERKNAKDDHCNLTVADLSRDARRVVDEAYAEDRAIFARLVASPYDPRRQATLASAQRRRTPDPRRTT